MPIFYSYVRSCITPSRKNYTNLKKKTIFLNRSFLYTGTVTGYPCFVLEFVCSVSVIVVVVADCAGASVRAAIAAISLPSSRRVLLS